MNNKNLIHVKFEYDEAIQGKKDILSSEIGLLQIAKAIKNHRTLRAEEFNAKLNDDLESQLQEIQNRLKELG